MMRLFERRASREARVYAEAQALLDAGLSVSDVLARFPGEAAWLAPMLEIGGSMAQSCQAVEPDPEFSDSLRQAFLAAARRPSFIAAPEPSTSWLRTAIASAAVASAVAGLGVLMFGLVTAEQAVPGDWNYTLKITRERLEETFTSGDQQIDIQIRQTEARVYELQRLSDRGPLSAGDLQKLDHEARELTEIARQQPFDEVQLTRLKGVFASAALVLDRTREQQPELAGEVDSTRRTVDEAVAATGAGPVTTISEPPPTATEEPTPVEESTPAVEPQPTATESPTATNTSEASPEPESTPTPDVAATQQTTPEATAVSSPDSTSTSSASQPGADPPEEE